MAEENLKHKTKKGIYWTFFNQFANNGLAFVVGIVMARLLTPEDYGITALPAVFMAVANIFMNAGFGQALVRKPEITEKDLATSFYYSLGVGIIMYVILFFSAPWISAFYNVPVLTPLIRITALNFLWGPLNTPQSVILQRRLDFKTPARISVTTNTIGAVVGITFAYMGYGLWALVITGIVSSLLGLVYTWWVVKWLPKTRWSKESFKYLWNYGNKIIGVNLLDTLCQNIAPIFIGKFYTPKDLGVYNRAYGYAQLPAGQLLGVLLGVTFPVLSKFQDDDEVLSRNYRRMIKVSAFISFPVFMGIVALATPIIIGLITERWAASITFLQILCFERMIVPIQALNRNLLQVKGRSDLCLKAEIIKKPTLFLIMLAALPFGVKMYCYSVLIGGIVSFIVNTHFTGKLLDIGLLKQLRDVTPAFLLSLTMLFIVVGINHFIVNIYLQLLVGLLVGIGVYIGGAYILKFKELDDVLYILKLKA